MAGDQRKLLSALDFLHAADFSEKQWVTIGMALKVEGVPCSVWDDWSRRGDDRWKPGDCAKRWNGFKDTAGDEDVTGGTIIQLARDRGWSTPEYKSEAIPFDGVIDTDWTPYNDQPKPAPKSEPKPEPKKPQPGQFMDYITRCAAAADQTDYFTGRGFTPETVKRFQLGYDADQKKIVIPYDREGSYYLTRSTSGKTYLKPGAATAGKEPIFNCGALYTDQPCFIVEAPLDAISIAQSGGSAASIVGTAHKKLLDQVQLRKPECVLIICLDFDDEGRKAQADLVKQLKDQQIEFIEAEFSLASYGGPKADCNDLLRDNPDQLRKDVWRNIKAAQRRNRFTAYKVSEYLQTGFVCDIDYFRQYKDRKTGYSNIDQYLTLYPGLATLGGAASLGKSTFAVTLADNLISQGETVIYFSLEQTPVELVSKSLSRRLYEKDPLTRLTNLDIKNGGTDSVLEGVKREYATTAGRFIIVRCNFTVTADDIQRYVEGFIDRTGTKPIIFIDYLQLISPPEGMKGDTRAGIDYSIKKLKTMQLDHELLVILISSFNRGGYYTPASYSDFKESSMLEYTSDYLWTLQLSVLEDKEFYSVMGSRGGLHGTDEKTRNDLVTEAMQQNPKEVEFVSLKSRNGKQSYKCFFKYNMQHDCFEPDLDSPHDQRPGLRQLPDDTEVPFDLDDIPLH